MNPRYVVFALVALLLGLGAYRELRKRDPEPPAPAPAPAPTPAPTAAPAKVSIASLRSNPARNDTEQEVVVQAPPGVECSIEHSAGDGSIDADDALAPKRADFQGRVIWRWKLEFPAFIDEPVATMKITVTCDGAKAERTYQLQR